MYVERMIGLGSSQAGANDIWCVCVLLALGERRMEERCKAAR